MEVNLNPAWSTSNILSMVLCSPALDKTHANGAHFGELIHSLKPMVDRLSQKLGKLLIVENLEAAATGDLTDSGGVEAMVEVAVPALHKDAAVTKALGIHLPTNVVQMDTFSNMSPSIFNS